VLAPKPFSVRYEAFEFIQLEYCQEDIQKAAKRNLKEI